MVWKGRKQIESHLHAHGIHREPKKVWNRENQAWQTKQGVFPGGKGRPSGDRTAVGRRRAIPNTREGGCCWADCISLP